MKFNSLRLLFILSVVRLSAGQYGSFGVGSGCFTNMNCGGNSICQNQRCACPSNSLQYGQNCYGGGGYGGGNFGGYGGNMGGGSIIIQPGGSCGGNMGGGYCGGGSSCNNGYCNCPQNSIMSGSYCQPINTVYPGQACNTYNQCGGGSYCQNSVCNCPSGFTGGSSGCMGGMYGGGYQTGGYGGMISPGQQCGGNYGSYCGGGSSCSQGYCMCPPNCLLQNNQCMGSGGGCMGGNFGGNYFGGGNLQNIISPGQPCGGNYGSSCSGGSFCNQGYCMCQPSCLLQNNQCMGSSSGCIGGGNYGGYSGGFGGGMQMMLNPGQTCGGGNFGNSCGGGSYCNQGYCTCPPNCVIQNNQCAQMGTGGYNNFGGYGGFNNVGVGGYCNQQSPCSNNAQCVNNQCQCSSGYYPQSGGCYRRKFYRAADPKVKLTKDTKETV